MAACRQPKILRFTKKSHTPPSDAPENTPEAPSSTDTPANTPRNLLSNIFCRSHRTRVEGPTTKVADASPGEQVEAAKQAMDGLNPIDPVLQVAVGLVGQADTVMTSIQNIEAILQPLKLFNSFVTTLSNVTNLSFPACMFDISTQVHPYVQLALGILTGASQVRFFFSFGLFLTQNLVSDEKNE
ncbi:hypothetical protein EDD15DRAFT_2375614 [Pisolithus albus]|nr:hypothetical protein EDD15DRAFT_2375614 [Pisolithus albus]